MLIDLLARIAKGGLHNPADLSIALGTTHELLEQMLDDLVRLGYLDPVMNSCSPATCPSCSGCCTASVGSSGRMLVLTKKGRRAVHTNT
jgi:hypothetical protein